MKLKNKADRFVAEPRQCVITHLRKVIPSHADPTADRMELRGDGGRVTCAPFVPGLPNLSPVLHVQGDTTDVIPPSDIQNDPRAEDERRRTKSEKVRRHLIFRGEIAFPKNASISEVETMEQAGNSKNKDALTIDNRIRPWTLT